MNEQQSTQPMETQRPTIAHGWATFEQLFELHRNVAKLTVATLELQVATQQQGLQLSKTLVQHYVQGVETTMLEMEQASGHGMEVASMAGQDRISGLQGSSRESGREVTTQGRTHRSPSEFGQPNQQSHHRSQRSRDRSQQPDTSPEEPNQWMPRTQQARRSGPEEFRNHQEGPRYGREKVQTGWQESQHGQPSQSAGPRYRQRNDRSMPPYERAREGSTGRGERRTDQGRQSRRRPVEREQLGTNRGPADILTPERIQEDAEPVADATADRESRSPSDDSDRPSEGEQESRKD